MAAISATLTKPETRDESRVVVSKDGQKQQKMIKYKANNSSIITDARA
jgi:hypothetical protein